MQGVIFAAGYGSRLRPLTSEIPKPLLPVVNVPMVSYPIRLLAYYGVRDIVLNVHHLAKEVQSALGDGSHLGVRIRYSEEDELLGTGGGLKRMHAYIDSDVLVVANSDIIVDFDLGDAIAYHQEHGAIATLVLRKDESNSNYGQIELDRTGRVRRILGEGDAESNQLMSYMFTGVHILDVRFLEYLPPDVPTCIIRYGYMKAMSNSETICGYVMDDIWMDSGTPAAYFQANKALLNQEIGLRYWDPLAGVNGGGEGEGRDARIWKGKAVSVAEGADLTAALYVGDQGQIHDNVHLGPDVILGEQVVVGAGSNLSSCVVMDGVCIEAGSVLRNCLVGRSGILPF